jgi:pimeloyl-ACP methyl ester carboxylesterase
MPLIHHVVTGQGQPPIVFVHGFGCALSDWDAQVAHFAPHHRTIALDLPAHGKTPGTAADASVERYGADVAELLRALDVPPAVLVGHSMGCRVVTEAALQAPEHTRAAILVDGSQFAPAMAAVLSQRFAEPDGYRMMVDGMFKDMFGAGSDIAITAPVHARALRLPQPVGEKLLTDMLRYDVGRLSASLSCLRVPVMALQSTYSNEKRERRSMHTSQTTPYLDMLRSVLPSIQIEIIPDTGHFPQLEQSRKTNAAIERFIAELC